MGNHLGSSRNQIQTMVARYCAGKYNSAHHFCSMCLCLVALFAEKDGEGDCFTLSKEKKLIH
jgi:hypothetical protein